MRGRGLILIGLSLVLAIMALYFLRIGNPPPPPVAAEMPTLSIVVASAPLNFGDHIGSDKVRLVGWPEDALPEGAFKKLDDVVGKGEDRVALQSIALGEPILDSKISGSGARATLSSIIGPNMRAVTLHVTDTTGVAGFVLPNDRVDVLLTRQQQNNPTTDILLQNVKVLAIDQVAQNPTDKDRKDKPMLAKVVTVEVSPVDAEKLVLAQQLGTLSLALRNYASLHEVDSQGVSDNTLWPTPPVEPEKKPAAEVAPPPPKPIPVTVLRGASGAVEVGK
jgi:pilus assembly protein CpaB